MTNSQGFALICYLFLVASILSSGIALATIVRNKEKGAIPASIAVLSYGTFFLSIAVMFMFLKLAKLLG